jgi:hypothetical protein
MRRRQKIAGKLQQQRLPLLLLPLLLIATATIEMVGGWSEIGGGIGESRGPPIFSAQPSAGATEKRAVINDDESAGRDDGSNEEMGSGVAKVPATIVRQQVSSATTPVILTEANTKISTEDGSNGGISSPTLPPSTASPTLRSTAASSSIPAAGKEESHQVKRPLLGGEEVAAGGGPTSTARPPREERAGKGGERRRQRMREGKGSRGGGGKGRGDGGQFRILNFKNKNRRRYV